MRQLTVLLVAASLLCSTNTWSQKKLTFSAFTGSGISFFRGPGAVNNSVYHRSGLPMLGSPYPDTIVNPFGRKAYTNFLTGLQADITFSSKWMLVLSAQYERSGGKLTGDSVIFPSSSIKTNGAYRRYYDYISINPQIGRIVFQKVVTLILHAGFDYTSKLDLGNQFDYTDQNGGKYSIGYQGGEPEKNDCRITVGTSITRKKWSLDVNYKHGLVNYNKYSGGNAYARLLHVRIIYAFLSKKI